MQRWLEDLFCFPCAANFHKRSYHCPQKEHRRPESILQIFAPLTNIHIFVANSDFDTICAVITCVVYFSESHSSGQLIVSYSWGLINRESFSPVFTALHNSTHLYIVAWFLLCWMYNIYFWSNTYRTCISLPFSSAAPGWEKLVNIGKCAGNDLGIGQKIAPANDRLVGVPWNCLLYHIDWDLWHEVGQASDGNGNSSYSWIFFFF